MQEETQLNNFFIETRLSCMTTIRIDSRQRIAAYLLLVKFQQNKHSRNKDAALLNTIGLHRYSVTF
jgi:hypothetical protein